MHAKTARRQEHQRLDLSPLDLARHCQLLKFFFHK
jgi:hypothetical protein